MGSQLNIKSDEAYALVAELAELTGESMTVAVIGAVRQRLDQERRARDKALRAARMLEDAAQIRAHMREPVSSDHSWLYGDDGLPA